MKTAKIALAALAIATQLISSGIIYPQAYVVTNYDSSTQLVTVKSAGGLIYEFRGDDETWEPGDIAACIMYNPGTPDNALDDHIISARYAGYADLLNP